jgi:hypothetical protein
MVKPAARGAGESGIALLLTLVTLALVAISLTLIAGAVAHRLELTRHDGQTVILGALTDAALAEGLEALAVSAFSSGIPEHDFGEGKIGCEIAQLGSASFRIVASGTYGARRREIEAFVQRTPGEIQVTRWRRLSDGDAADLP